MKLMTTLLFAGVLCMPAVNAESSKNHDHNHGHAQSTTELSAGTVDPNGEKINVSVFGLVCDFCAQAIEKVFMKQAAVSGIKVNLAAGLIEIFTKQGEQLGDSTLTKLIVDAGYNVDSISRD